MLSILFACALSCAAQAGNPPANEQTTQPLSAAERDPKAWKVFSSAEGGFSIESPVKLKERTELVDRERGEPQKMHLFEAHTRVSYQVLYMSFDVSLDADAELVKLLLDDGRDGGVRNVNGQLLEEREINLEGHAGRALKVRLPNGDTIRSRLYVAGRRFYAVSILTPDKDAPAAVARSHEEVAHRFLDSFKITSARSVLKSVPLADSWARAGEPPVEGEVGALLKELRGRGETVIGPCEGESCRNLSGTGASDTFEKGTVRQGKIVKLVQPDYPAMAKAIRAHGVVRVQVVVSEEGKVIAAQVIDGHPFLQAPALKAAREAVFEPTLLDGKPAKTVGIIPFNFALPR